MYYTILDINEYFAANNLKFSWEKSLEFVNMKLQPYYKVHNGSYCPDIEQFKNCYDKEPIYVPIDNRPEVKSGQLFTLIDIVNNPNNIPILKTSDQTVIKDFNGVINLTIYTNDKNIVVCDVPTCPEYYESDPDDYYEQDKLQRDYNYDI